MTRGWRRPAVGLVLVALGVGCRKSTAHDAETHSVAAQPPATTDAAEAKAPVAELPYTIASHSLSGCRTFDASECEYCVRYDHLGEKHFEKRGNLRPEHHELVKLTHLPNCAQCMVDDELLLRDAFRRIAVCDCSVFVHSSSFVDGCFAPESCKCACREWVQASLRCPPQLVSRSQEDRAIRLR